MKILIIIYSYKPAISARAFRWAVIAEQWVLEGHEIDVLCSWRPDVPKKEILNGVRVYRVGESVFERLRYSLNGGRNPVISRNRNSSIVSATGNGAGFLKAAKFVKGIYDLTWKKLYWPDYACLWFFPAVKKAKTLIKEMHYNSVITVSLPFTGHLVGLALNNNNPDIQWLADSGDPFCFMDQTPTNNHCLYGWLNRKMEQKVFDRADHLAVTTELTARQYNMLFPGIKDKISVIPPLANINDEIDGADRDLFDRSKTIISFVGTLYKNIREPDGFLRIMEAVIKENPYLSKRIELHFYGVRTNCDDNFKRFTMLQNMLHLHGTVPRNTAINAMLQSDLLINIGNSTTYQLPSKIVEYVSTGKPIINLCSIKEDSAMAYLNDYPLVFNCIVNTNTIHKDARDLLEFILSTRGKTVALHVIQKFINPHTTKAIAAKYMQELVSGISTY